MNSQLYQQELFNLRQLAAEFSQKHPAIAPQLSGPSPDPDVERILEGVAFLTANIQQKLEDDFSEFAQSLMQMIFPHYLRPLPASTIIQFNAKSILKDTLVINKGTSIDSKEVEGTSCRFQTCQPILVAPATISAIEVEQLGAGKKVIELTIKGDASHFKQWCKNGIEFYLGGDYVGSADLFLLLQHHLTGIDLCLDNNNQLIQLPSSVLTFPGFDQQSMLPFPSTGFPAFRTLQEFFLFKEKFLFIKLNFLENLDVNSQLSIRFQLNNVNFPLPSMPADRFLLHCSTAINLFSHDAEPIKLDNRQSEIKIKPKKGRGKSKSEHYCIHSVQQVIGNNRRAGSKTTYNPINGFYAGNQDNAVYQLTQRSEDNNSHTYLSLHYPQQLEITQGETLSINMQCTNGDLASQLRPGDINLATSSTSELVEFKNILPPSDAMQIPSDGHLIWRLISHLSLNFLSLANSDNLQALLSLYIFSGANTRQEETINRKKIAGICDVTVQACDRLVEGIMLRGQEITITLNRDYYASLGDMNLFCSLLQHLFHSYASLNCFTAFSMTELNSGEQYHWPVKLGEQSLL